MSTVDRAIQIAVEAHQGQKDKAGAPYILHPLRVMLRMETEEQMMAAVLHDVVEDSSWTLTDLRQEGFPEQVIEAVDYLSRRDSETYDEFIDRIKGSSLAIRVKLADLEDNMDLKRVKKVTDKEKERMMKYHAAWCNLKGVLPNQNKREIL